MVAQLITVEPVEADLTAERIDERLAAGWFPWGQRWMTCRAWPMEEGPRDTVWVRVRLAARRRSDRARKLVREGCTVTLHEEPVLDDEHQRLYELFRETRHPDWTREAENLLLHGGGAVTQLYGRTREIAVRDAGGRLCAFRWFLQGKAAIAGISSIYDTTRDGLGSVARELADEWAERAGCTFSYPGYVWPGAPETWYYKVKRGRTEWLDLEQGRWRSWDGDEPRPEDLVLAELRRRLAPLGEIVSYPGWAAACVEPSLRGLTSPYFVVGDVEGDQLTLVVWDLEHRRHQQLRVVLRERESTDAEEPSDDAPSSSSEGASAR